MSIPEEVATLLRLAHEEDIGSGDKTSEACISADTQASARIVAKEELVICGHEFSKEFFALCDSEIHYQIKAAEGSLVAAGDLVASVEGPYRQILSGERAALNFLQHLSGVATKAREASKIAKEFEVEVLDTRKTLPGWRYLEKYAVKIGGGVNHRAGLYDAVLIKDNHIDALGGDVAKAIETCREKHPALTIEVEVRSRSELDAALTASPDIILLDNLSPTELRSEVSYIRETLGDKAPRLEGSGGITLENLREYAATGVDAVSMGSLTHSVRAADLSLLFDSIV